MTAHAYSITIWIPMLPDLQVAAGKGNRWAQQKHSKLWHGLVRAAVLEQQFRPEDPLALARVKCVRHSSGQEPDPDNLAASFKAAIDGLVRCGVLEDDKPENFEGRRPTYGYVKSTRAEQGVSIKVTDASIGPDLSIEARYWRLMNWVAEHGGDPVAVAWDMKPAGKGAA